MMKNMRHVLAGSFDHFLFHQKRQGILFETFYSHFLWVKGKYMFVLVKDKINWKYYKLQRNIEIKSWIY